MTESKTNSGNPLGQEALSPVAEIGQDINASLY
jgi:hypothetical protein